MSSAHNPSRSIFWVVLKDVCLVLWISNTTDTAKRLDEYEKATFDSIECLRKDTVYISESGLCAVILRSDKAFICIKHLYTNFRTWWGLPVSGSPLQCFGTSCFTKYRGSRFGAVDKPSNRQKWQRVYAGLRVLNLQKRHFVNSSVS